MLRIFQCLRKIRTKICKWCRQYERKNHRLYNVVNCRAYHILLSALDHQVYHQLALAFDVPARHWNVTVFRFKIRQIWLGSANNKFKMSQHVYAHVSQQLRFLENLYQPTAREIQKFVRVVNERGWDCAYLWESVTEKPWQPELWRLNIVLDTYTPIKRRQFHKVCFDDNESKQILFNFFLFDFQHYILSQPHMEQIVNWFMQGGDLSHLLHNDSVEMFVGSTYDSIIVALNQNFATINLYKLPISNTKKECMSAADGTAQRKYINATRRS